MANFEIVDQENKIAFLTFSEMVKPIQEKDKVKGYIKFGKRNDFPNELVRYFEEHPEHSAIVGAKARYLYGEGLTPINETQKEYFDKLKEGVNRFETFEQFMEKVSLDCEMFNSFYVQVVTDLAGKPLEYYHLQFSNCRLSEDSSVLYYCDDFSDRTKNIDEFKAYQLGDEAGTYFLKFQYYQPKKNRKEVYVLPEYKGALKEIKSDIDISTFNTNYVMKGFSAGTLVTFFNGEQTPEAKRQIKDKLTKSLTGVENAGEVVINYADKDGQAAQISALNVDDLDKKFEFISKRYQQKIITGHNVTNPELFGIKQEGQLGTRVSLNDSYELFLNTYTKPRQKVLANFIEELIFLKSGVDVQLEFKELKPIGLDLLSAEAIAVQDRSEVRKLLGLKVDEVEETQADKVNKAINALSPLVANKVLESMSEDEIRALAALPPKTAPKLDVNGNPLPIEADSVNSTLTNLTGRQFQGLMRIVSKFDAGKISKEAALALMTSGFGLSNEDALKFLNENDSIEDAPQQFSAEDKQAKILARFDELAEDLNFEFEVLLDEEVHLHSSSDALRYELKASKMAFETVITVTDLDNAVLNALKGNPTISIDELAKMTNKNYLDITESIGRLKQKALVVDSASGLKPTAKADKKETEPVTETEIRTVYYYKLADNAPRTNKEGKVIKTRSFCQDMLKKTSASKAWTFEKIDSMNNEFGMNVWNYRGGFFTNSNTGETTPFCRHVWAAKTIKIVKKK